MTIITKRSEFLEMEFVVQLSTYYPLHVDDLGIHRPFSHRYSVEVQLRYTVSRSMYSNTMRQRNIFG